MNRVVLNNSWFFYFFLDLFLSFILGISTIIEVEGPHVFAQGRRPLVLDGVHVTREAFGLGSLPLDLP